MLKFYKRVNMSVSFNPQTRRPDSVPSDTLYATAGPAVLPQLSEVRSSITPAPNSGSPKGFCTRLCQKIGEVLRSIFAFFASCFSSSSTNARNVSSPSSVETRIEKGMEIFDRNLTQLCPEGVAADQSAIIFILKYNNQIAVHVRKLNDPSEHITVFARRHLSALLTTHANCQDGKLELETLLFEKLPGPSFPNCRFNYRYADSFYQFPGRTSTSIGGGSGESSNIDFQMLADVLAGQVPREGTNWEEVARLMRDL
jgi:hypothetical protein